MKIFIAGCARSGTSLTRGLMGSFENVYAHGEFSEGYEFRASAFERYEGRAEHSVLKRTANCHKTLPELRADVELLYCVRHPYDVLTSTHRISQMRRRFHVSPKRWRAEYAALCDLRRRQPARRIFILRYEDLIRDPDQMQQRIADHFGLVPLRNFTESVDGTGFRTESIERWRDDSDLLVYFASFRGSLRRSIERFTREFGYVLPALRRRRFSFLKPLREILRPPRSARRLRTNPIIRPEMLPGRDGENINGPSLIAAPEWLPHRLGKYYLYFADHRGAYIRLAYADRLKGPWSIYQPGTLKLGDAPMCRDHIASPDVHVDEASRQIRMYFHGPVSGGGGGDQKSFVAVSSDGIAFRPSDESLAGPYLRCVRWNEGWLGLDMDGCFHRSVDGLTTFEPGPTKVFTFRRGVSLRHVALRIVGPTLEVYYTCRGDIPERIRRGLIDLASDWAEWRMRDVELVLQPERKWEGARLPVAPSRPGPARKREHALRDPAIFVENGRTYLLYAVAGESGIAIAALE